MNTELMYKLLKYLGQGIVIYFLFKYVPKEPMDNRDILLITLIVILSYAVFENITSLYYGDEQQSISSTQCNKQCEFKENITSGQIVQKVQNSQNSQFEHMAGSVSANSTVPTVQTVQTVQTVPTVPTVLTVPTNTNTTTTSGVEVDTSDVSDVSDEFDVESDVVESNVPVVPVAPVAPVAPVVPDVKKQAVKKSNIAGDVYVKAEELENIRKYELSQYNVSTMANTGSYVSPDLKQKGVVRNNDGSFTITPVNYPQVVSKGSRPTDDVMGTEMPYNYTDYNSLPVPTTGDTFENGFSFLPPAQWFPVPPHPPVCVTEKVCPVCPIFTEGTDINLKEWNQSRRISPPDNINVKYIEEKLNSGR